MNKKTLLDFMKRLLESGSKNKSAVSLAQLKEILETQNADPELIELVDKALNSLPEAKEAAQSNAFTEANLRVAEERAEIRKRREAQMAQYGRC